MRVRSIQSYSVVKVLEFMPVVIGYGLMSSLAMSTPDDWSMVFLTTIYRGSIFSRS
jgi:hypothetical protein